MNYAAKRPVRFIDPATQRDHHFTRCFAGNGLTNIQRVRRCFARPEKPLPVRIVQSERPFVRTHYEYALRIGDADLEPGSIFQRLLQDGRNGRIGSAAFFIGLFEYDHVVVCLDDDAVHLFLKSLG